MFMYVFFVKIKQKNELKIKENYNSSLKKW